MSRMVMALSLTGIAFAGPGLAQQAQPRASQILERAQSLTSVQSTRCDDTISVNANEIIVCGDPDRDSRYRLPLPELAVEKGKRIRNPIPNGNAEIVQKGSCYTTIDERNCFKGLQIVSTSLGNSGTGDVNRTDRLWELYNKNVAKAEDVAAVRIDPSPTDAQSEPAGN